MNILNPNKQYAYDFHNMAMPKENGNNRKWTLGRMKNYQWAIDKETCKIKRIRHY